MAKKVFSRRRLKNRFISPTGGYSTFVLLLVSEIITSPESTVRNPSRNYVVVVFYSYTPQKVTYISKAWISIIGTMTIYP